MEVRTGWRRVVDDTDAELRVTVCVSMTTAPSGGMRRRARCAVTGTLVAWVALYSFIRETAAWDLAGIAMAVGNPSALQNAGFHHYGDPR